MLRHKGKRRNFSHNLKLASVLAGVAGAVNITGILSLGILTTNVTGHFAFFSEQFFLHHYRDAFVFLVYILFFFSGAFVTGILMEWVTRLRPRIAYVLPVTLEIALLTGVALCKGISFSEHWILPVVLSCILLFSMGLQNALVTKVSQSVVRTTHLTGLFTDLGIELAQLFFSPERPDKMRLRKSVLLKITIIGFFFLGGIAGGVLYQHWGLHTLFLPVALLAFSLWYDRLLFRFHYLKRKFKDAPSA